MNLNKIFKKERKIVFLVMIVYFLGVMVGVANAEPVYRIYMKNYYGGGTEIFKSHKYCSRDHGIYIGKNIDCGLNVRDWEVFIPYTSFSYMSKENETTEGLNLLKPVSP